MARTSRRCLLRTKGMLKNCSLALFFECAGGIFSGIAVMLNAGVIALTGHDIEMPNRTLADISDREQICCVDNVPDTLGRKLEKELPPPGTLKDVPVKQKSSK